MGTIAGDNTIFLVASTAGEAEELVGLLAEITGDRV